MDPKLLDEKLNNLHDTLDLMKDLNDVECKILFDKYIGKVFVKSDKLYEEIEKICRANVGYELGRRDLDERKRLESVLDVSHPIFGKVSKLGFPSTKEALMCGLFSVDLKTLRENWDDFVMQFNDFQA